MNIDIIHAIESIDSAAIDAALADYDPEGIIEYADWEPVADSLIEAKLGRELTDEEGNDLQGDDSYVQLGADVMAAAEKKIAASK
jgi:hypothetical protein